MEFLDEYSVFDKIGGRGAVHLVVEQFYDKVMSDEKLIPFFENADMQVQRGKMKAFLMMALGGPIKFTGKDLRHAHVHLVKAGLSDEHFDKVAVYLDDVLEVNSVSVDLRETIASVVEQCREAVLDR